MEFFLFLEDNPSDCLLFRLTPTEPEATFQNIIDKFSESYQKTHETTFDSSKYSLYIDDLTFPLHNHKITKIEDLTQSILSLKIYHFDLILSITDPYPIRFEEEDVYEDTNPTLQ